MLVGKKPTGLTMLSAMALSDVSRMQVMDTPNLLSRQSGGYRNGGAQISPDQIDRRRIAVGGTGGHPSTTCTHCDCHSKLRQTRSSSLLPTMYAKQKASSVGQCLFADVATAPGKLGVKY